MVFQNSELNGENTSSTRHGSGLGGSNDQTANSPSNLDLLNESTRAELAELLNGNRRTQGLVVMGLDNLNNCFVQAGDWRFVPRSNKPTAQTPSDSGIVLESISSWLLARIWTLLSIVIGFAIVPASLVLNALKSIPVAVWVFWVTIVLFATILWVNPAPTMNASVLRVLESIPRCYWLFWGNLGICATLISILIPAPPSNTFEAIVESRIIKLGVCVGCATMLTLLTSAATPTTPRRCMYD